MSKADVLENTCSITANSHQSVTRDDFVCVGLYNASLTAFILPLLNLSDYLFRLDASGFGL